jgi:hypothetical protein
MDPLLKTVRALEQRIEELEAENRYLRHAANVFGELAERLNQRFRAAQMLKGGSAQPASEKVDRGL